MKIEKCSCEESQHLRAALKMVRKICTTDTDVAEVYDLAQCANLADQGLRLQKLVGDPVLEHPIPGGKKMAKKTVRP